MLQAAAANRGWRQTFRDAPARACAGDESMSKRHTGRAPRRERGAASMPDYMAVPSNSHEIYGFPVDGAPAMYSGVGIVIHVAQTLGRIPTHKRTTVMIQIEQQTAMSIDPTSRTKPIKDATGRRSKAFRMKDAGIYRRIQHAHMLKVRTKSIHVQPASAAHPGTKAAL